MGLAGGLVATTIAQAMDQAYDRIALSNSPVTEIRLDILALRIGLLAGAMGAVVIEHGVRAPVMPLWINHGLQGLLLAVYTLDVWVGARRGRVWLRDVEPDWVDALIVCVSAVGMGTYCLWGRPWGWRLVEAAVVLLLIMELWRLQVGLSRRFYRPGLMLPVSFVSMIVVGTLLLKIPVAVGPGQSLSWIDAAFTMTSAVCVTGLTVRDTATQFTPFGQAILGVFIQLGGLGIVVFGSVLAMMLGAKRSLREDLTLKGMIHDLPLRGVASYVRFVVMTTIAIELLGAAAMAAMWPGDLTGPQRIGHSLFHSISAFCNAGFALHSDNLESYRYSFLVHGVVVPLIVVGGIGFPVLEDFWRLVRDRWRQRGRLQRDGFRIRDLEPEARGGLTLHTKLVLITTAVLYLYGVTILAAGQLKPYLNDYFQQGVTANRSQLPPLTVGRFGGIVADAGFTSITARTAGFNTIPMDEVSPAGRFGVMTLMMVGASPGGTGGGMKTATVAVLLLTVAATLRKRPTTEAFSRAIREELVRKAATLAAGFMGLIGVTTLLLCLSEPYPFEKIFFEAVSAASTTGLSLGITPDLTGFGKITVMAAMFLGRVGPLTVVGALVFAGARSRPYRYAHEPVVLG